MSTQLIDFLDSVSLMRKDDAAAQDEADGPILCPWNGRRLPWDMYLKLFVIYFTVIGNYAHLMHLRREPRFLLSYLLMVACPIAGAALFVVPVIALTVQMVIIRGDWRTLNKSIGILIGRVPPTQNDAEDGEHEAGISWPPEMNPELARGLVVQLVTLMQCLTSLWLFARRVQHGSAALYDHRILQLAVLGMVVSIMSIMHLVLKPRYPSERDVRCYPKQIAWLQFLRPIIDLDLLSIIGVNETPETTTNAQQFSELPLWYVDFLYACIMLWIAEISGLEVPNIVGVQALINAMLDFSWVLLRFAPYGFLISLFTFIQFRKRLFRTRVKNVLGLPFIFFSMMILLVIVLPTLNFLLMLLSDTCAKPVLTGVQLYTLCSKPAAWEMYEKASFRPPLFAPDWSSIWTYGHVPTSFPCPQAWQDDVEDYVWWLA